MTPNMRMLGGLIGLAATGAAIGAAVLSSRRHSGDDPYAEEPFGRLPSHRTRMITADDGTTIAVSEVDPVAGGEPELTTVFVHGLALSSDSWHFQRRAMADLTSPRVRQVHYDHRGHGRSGAANRHTSTLDQLAKDLDAVLRAVVPEGPVVLVGHSMGGMAIMALAELRSKLFGDRIRGVVLINTSAGGLARDGLSRPVLSKYNPLVRSVGTIARWRPGLIEWARLLGSGVTGAAVRELAFGSSKLSPAVLAFTMRMLDASEMGMIAGFLDTLGTHDRYAALAALRRCEVLILGADRDRITAFAHAERIAHELPDAQFVTVAGAGHLAMLEQPDLVNAHLIGLVQRCTPKPSLWRRLRKLG